MSTWVLMDIRLLLGAPTRLSMLTQVQQLLHKHGTYDTTGGGNASFGQKKCDTTAKTMSRLVKR